MPAFGSLLILAALASAPALAQSVEDVYPLEPADGATIGPKGMFRLGVKGTDFGKMKFRIEMSKDGFETIAWTMDQTKHPNNWGLWAEATEDEQPVVCYIRKPIPDGDYEWRVSAWNGVNWVDGKKKFRLTIDAVPPAEVTGVRMAVDKDGKKVVLDWDPVVTDRDGRPEQVGRYKIYRYERKSVFFSVRTYEIGTTTDTHFEDSGDLALRTPILFYKISAEDEAGNEAGSFKDRPSSPQAFPEPPSHWLPGRRSS
jgi:hypothetical protein